MDGRFRATKRLRHHREPIGNERDLRSRPVLQLLPHESDEQDGPPRLVPVPAEEEGLELGRRWLLDPGRQLVPNLPGGIREGFLDLFRGRGR